MKLTKKGIEEYVKALDIYDAIKYIEEKQEKINLDSLLKKYIKKKEAYEKEVLRYKSMCEFENELYDRGFINIAGVDEAGRGPLAGPVVAAAVILKKGDFIAGLNDSKKLSEKRREELFDEITKKAVAYGVGIVDEKCIDKINILRATKLAMMEAVGKINPDYVLVDAVELEKLRVGQNAIIKGDAKSVSIAAASIIAKVTRDRIMVNLDKEYPQYGFLKHKGYGTKEHIDAIKKFGASPIHRKTFIGKFK